MKCRTVCIERKKKKEKGQKKRLGLKLTLNHGTEMRSMDDLVKYPTVEFQLAEVATLLKFHSLEYSQFVQIHFISKLFTNIKGLGPNMTHKA
jgi:hypothetical protein